uniref:Uncharacterized protein n=1 Tax=Chlamydomonas euryale TaxID=1486919 RepID=A0A7R9V3N2_9CHLO|mmetsp:Transcript_16885/g.50627  ORF Transcript_16885/g.50627 Transcript_16885/m.50627 type:complete len:122 (+) Transcript_16885:21-386(+)
MVTWCNACFNLSAVWIGYFSPKKFKVALFTRKPEVVTDAFGRLFGTWTVVTCMLCVVCANNISNGPIYAATLGSFGVAFTYMTLEMAVYKTIGLRGAMSPLIIAGVSIVWMGLGYSKYVKA